MRHFLLGFILFLFLLPSMAQNKHNIAVLKSEATLNDDQLQLLDNQRVIGDFNKGRHGAITLRGTESEAASFFSSEMLKPFIGCKIKAIRFYSEGSDITKKLFIREGNSIFDAKDIKAELTTTTTKKGWENINLEKEVVITDNIKGLAVGYSLDLGSRNKVTMGINGTDSYKDNLFVYIPKDNNWANLKSDAGLTLAMQLIVETPNDSKFTNVVISHVDVPEYIKVGESFDLKYWLSNCSTEGVGNFELDVLLDGKKLKSFKVDKSLDPEQTNKMFSIEKLQPNITTTGKHRIELALKKINDEDLTAVNGLTNSKKLLCYNNVLPRQKTLVEEFTSERCANCFRGIAAIKELKKYYKDKIEVIAVHLNEESYPDDVAAKESLLLKKLGNVTNIPSMASNRISFKLGNKRTIAHTVIASGDIEAIKKFFDATNYNDCIFTSLGIENKYDKGTNSIDINVTGNGVENAKELLEDYALYVVATEDNVDGHQGDENGILVPAKHNDVLRTYVSDITGDNDLNWNGNNFSKQYTLKVANGWKANDMKIVAFIAPKIEGIGIEYGLKNLLVQNCTSQPVAKRDAGIVDVTNTLETYEIGRYTIDGKYITKPVRGINIIKYSNGTIKKELIK